MRAPRRALRLIGVLLIGLVRATSIAAAARAGDCVVVDQRNLVSDANLGVFPGQSVAQSFVWGRAGLLVGIEIAPLLDSLTADDLVTLEVLDPDGQVLGTVSRPANGFPPGSGVIPAPLQADAIGAGYFDVSSLGIVADRDAALSYRVHHAEFGVCDPEVYQCIAGDVGRGCYDDYECDAQMRVGDKSGNVYTHGSETLNGESVDGYDMAFKTFLSVPCETSTPIATPTVTETSAPPVTPSPTPTVAFCAAVPRSECRVPAASRGRVRMQTREGDPTKARLRWKWTKGAATGKGDFGDPTSRDDYTVCLYDAGVLVTTVRVPAGDRWRESSSGFRFTDPELDTDGARRLVLVGGGEGKARIEVEARGGQLEVPVPSALSGPVEVQVARVTGAHCWSATFSAPFSKRDARTFVDVSD